MSIHPSEGPAALSTRSHREASPHLGDNEFAGFVGELPRRPSVGGPSQRHQWVERRAHGDQRRRSRADLAHGHHKASRSRSTSGVEQLHDRDGLLNRHRRGRTITKGRDQLYPELPIVARLRDHRHYPVVIGEGAVGVGASDAPRPTGIEGRQIGGIGPKRILLGIETPHRVTAA